MEASHGTAGPPAGDLRAVLNQLITSAETLAAVGLALTARSGDLVLPAGLADRVMAVATAVGGDLDNVDAAQLKAMGSLARAMLAQAAAFSANPQEPAAWAVTDPLVLQMLGQASAAIGPAIHDHVIPRYRGVADRLAAPDARVLDVGTGVGALACAFANLWPATTVVGLDVWPAALDLARANIVRAGLVDRVELRQQDVVTLADDDSYDLVWFAGPFIPESSLDQALAAVAKATRPGGLVVYGTFGGADPLHQALADLRVLRSGGPIVTDDAIGERLRAVGLTDVVNVGADIGLPARFVAARRPNTAHR